jgi:hypothetical protein
MSRLRREKGERGRWNRLTAVLVLVAGVGCLPRISAQENRVAIPEVSVREIFVPLEDLNVILESETQRAILTRQEYAELLSKAKTSAERLAPIATAVMSAQYHGRLEPGRAVIEGTIEVEVFHSGLHLVPLQLSGVGIRTARLGDKPALLARDPQHGLVLVVPEAGKHTLHLTLTAPLATTAAQQSLQVELPHAPAAR